jgi:hypothetical protein
MPRRVILLYAVGHSRPAEKVSRRCTETATSQCLLAYGAVVRGEDGTVPERGSNRTRGAINPFTFANGDPVNGVRSERIERVLVGNLVVR